MRSRAIEGWSNTAARLASRRRVAQQDVILYQMDGPCRLSWRTTPLAQVWGKHCNELRKAWPDTLVDSYSLVSSPHSATEQFFRSRSTGTAPHSVTEQFFQIQSHRNSSTSCQRINHISRKKRSCCAIEDITRTSNVSLNHWKMANEWDRPFLRPIAVSHMCCEPCKTQRRMRRRKEGDPLSGRDRIGLEFYTPT
jgi:hypothetical protein